MYGEEADEGFTDPRAELLDTMRALVANAQEVEETALSPEIYRFDGTEWKVAGSERARA